MGEDSATMWIDVSMWTGLTGKVQPFTEVQCEVPGEPEASPSEWNDWALDQLKHVAHHDGWQPGRYHFDVQRRDPSGRVLDRVAQGVWDWRG
jgi:hypothetical protein